METEPTPTPDDLPNEVEADDIPDEPAEGEDSGAAVEDSPDAEDGL
jgi:hypothetical protein